MMKGGDRMPLVTVGIPAYNRPHTLERTLRCMTQQTYRNLEIIVSDNCSTDPAVQQLIQQYAAQDKRIIAHRQEQNISIVPNFQFLLNQAGGDYFIWAADDDEWDDNFIEVCVEGLETHKDAVLAMGDLKIVGTDGVPRETALRKGFMQHNLYSRLFHWVRSDGDNKYFFCGVYRSSAVKNVVFENNWGGDHMLLLEVITKGKFLYLPGKTNFYYYRGGSSTTTARIKKAFGIKSRFYYSEGYVFRYLWYHFRFRHLNFFQKTALFFVNGLGLLFNKNKLLYYALIKKPVKDMIQFLRQKWGKYKSRRLHPVTYDQDGLTTVHNTGFMHNAAFSKAEQAGAATGSWKNIHWRVHTILWAAAQCKNIEGDFVECGTNKGGFARAIVEYLDFGKMDKRFYLLDTFEGLADELLTDAEKKAGRSEHFKKEYLDCYAQVQQTFAPFSNVRLVRGKVPATLGEVPSERIAFASIDMNSIVPEIEALNYFWPKLSKGGMIVLDDYAYVTCDLQYDAHNKWAEEKGVKILSLPTGQGLIVKTV
jgi:O-methyltransferase